MTTAAAALFDDEFLAKLEYLNLIARRFRSPKRSEPRRRKRGGGLEFADYRPYVSGDDFRHLDWKAYLRLNRLILKLFEEREDLPIYFFVDVSQSMTYGSPSKLDYARRVAAALSYISLANLDRVHIVSFAGTVAGQLPPQRGKARIFRIFRFLADAAGAGATDARQSFRTYCAQVRRRGLAVVISDLFDDNGFEGGLDVLRHFGHDVFVIHVASRDDIDPPLTGDVQLVDGESLGSREVSITPTLLAAYRAEFERYCDDLENYCVRYQLGYIRTTTDFPFEELVMRVLRQGRFLK